LQPGSHLDLIGSFTPAMREADDACFQGARLFVDAEEALQKSGDLLIPMQHGVLRPDDVRGTLTTLCKGVATGRKNATERTVFKSVGTALEDLAAAVLVYETGKPTAPH
jgi:ornithine cyclodeaminase/alanine dehydrogenase-like protein (mu-crystallin family)